MGKPTIVSAENFTDFEEDERRARQRQMIEHKIEQGLFSKGEFMYLHQEIVINTKARKRQLWRISLSKSSDVWTSGSYFQE